MGGVVVKEIFFMIKLLNEYNFIPLLQIEAFSVLQWNVFKVKDFVFYISSIRNKQFGGNIVKSLPLQCSLFKT